MKKFIFGCLVTFSGVLLLCIKYLLIGMLAIAVRSSYEAIELHPGWSFWPYAIILIGLLFISAAGWKHLKFPADQIFEEKIEQDLH
ncbi:hypothetical protein OIN60_03735 [Paenibacillus sp. P96]|uniref:DUF5668 domain-containing protein n=1 Tax=Paenibacillus zeirhizosphaerae TaxID=2987519 RepID=A0ABT9FME6_9BACL|nr:hypothetical protein [Paenibacillus sp. P96]MDP4095902.1 hypothetical protein [Paenibacillus sp. P96]